MGLKICSYNIEWFDNLFKDNNQITTEPEKVKKLDAIAEVLKKVDADIVGIIEAPNNAKNGTKKTVDCLNNFTNHYHIRSNKSLIGFQSKGQQEIAIIYDPSKVGISHAPGGTGPKKPSFIDKFEFDTDEDRIKEIYEFFRPPLEVNVNELSSNKSFKLLVAHTKSKGVFSSSDLIHWDKENYRNRRKLFAECSWIRRRVDEWLDSGQKVIVMGDINDGPGMDNYEHQFGKSAVEIIMGNLYCPGSILKSHIGQPKWGKYGWNPSSTSFKDRFTDKYVNVLIDHILISQDISVVNNSHIVWNPFQNDELKPKRDILLKASDHFPVSVDIVL